jgi:hypothetical protein
MAEAEIIINGRTLVHGTGVKESLEKSGAESTVCFDEVLTDGTGRVSYKLDIDRVVYESASYYLTLSKIFKRMLSTPGTITTRQTIKYKNKAPFVIVKNYSGCILDGKDYEMKPEERAAQNLSFICSNMEEYIEDAPQ